MARIRSERASSDKQLSMYIGVKCPLLVSGVLALARHILKAWELGDFLAVVVYGVQRIGKTAYALKVLAEVMGELYNGGKPDYSIETAKRNLVFPPQQFMDRVDAITMKEPMIIWDDAGLWLNALDWYDPWVKAVGKYMNVIGTDLAAIIFTAPLPTWVTTKVRGMPQITTVKIIKRGNKQFSRRGTAYRNWLAPDMKKSGVRKLFYEDYSCRIPDHLYLWYNPLRERYATIAKALMRRNFPKQEADWMKEIIGTDSWDYSSAESPLAQS